MMEHDNKKQIIKMSAIVLGLFAVILSVTYAFINIQLEGTKKQVITAGTLDLELDEDENNLTITEALPMYDEVGMIQDAFTFRLINNVSTPTNYILKLTDITTGNKLPTSIVKYGLTKNGVGEPALLSTLPDDGQIDAGKIGNKETIEYTLRLWIDSSVTDNSVISGKSLSYRIDVEVSQETATDKQTITLAGVEKEVAVVEETMFNYTSEGCIMDIETYKNVCSADAANGIYSLEDDDGPSYFYRGEVDNLVQFGEYEQDYYVYQYDEYDFVSLEACQYAYSDCSESNKIKKYDAGTPLYWKIIRINGDGTIRMIYAGTTPDATGYDTGIGLSRYNEEYGDPKYTGYTYDRTTNEVKSAAKTEIDTWYANVFEGTIYDNKIATGKFCSDSSDYGEVTDFWGSTYNAFGRSKRLLPIYYNLEGNVSPTFKCAATSETYGGSYNLKAGLITSDEIVAAGGNLATNDSYYLYNGTKGNSDGKEFWSMSPAYFDNGFAYVGIVYYDGGASESSVNVHEGLLRPVINLKAGTTFKSGTDGSKLTPYQINQ